MVQQVKDPGLSLLWLGSLLWHRFDPGPRTSACLPGGKKKEEEEEGIVSYYLEKV